MGSKLGEGKYMGNYEDKGNLVRVFWCRLISMSSLMSNNKGCILPPGTRGEGTPSKGKSMSCFRQIGERQRALPVFAFSQLPSA